MEENHLYIKLKLKLVERICKDKEAPKINSDKIIMTCKPQLIKDIVSLIHFNFQFEHEAEARLMIIIE